MFVSGVATRCGTSLVCQMLAAGGLRVFHDVGMGYPSFETRLQIWSEDDAWLLPLRGQAVKWLEPQRQMPPALPFPRRVIWLTRNHREQARSAVKFAGACGHVLRTGARRAFESSLRRDERPALGRWIASGAAVLPIRFEQLLAEPLVAAAAIAMFLDVPAGLDVDAMARQVRVRPATCLPGLLEYALIDEGPR